MNIKITQFLAVCGYGTKLIIIDTDTDEEVFVTDNFQVPYWFDETYRDRTVRAFGVFDGKLLVWI